MQIEICPLCGLKSHVGKCGRLSKGEWWCGLCLVSKLSRSDLTAPPISAAVLLAAGVQRTDKWCVRCGSTVCESHRFLATSYYRAHPRCVPDCLARRPLDFQLLRTALEKYVPDYLTAGPPRCRVCSLPAHRQELCQRHYKDVRMGRPVLNVHKTRRRHGYKRQLTHCYLLPKTRALVQHLSARDGQTIAEWIVGAIEDRIKSESKLNPALLDTVYGYAALPGPDPTAEE